MRWILDVPPPTPREERAILLGLLIGALVLAVLAVILLG